MKKVLGMCAVFSMLSLTLLISCGTPPTNNTNSTNNTNNTNNQSQVVTYHGALRALLEKNCVTCHQKGGVAPFPLTNYKQVNAYKSAVQSAVQSRRMPPWHADNSCAEYEHNMALTEDEIKLVTQWVKDGAVEGSPEDYTPPTKTETVGLPRVDMTLKLPQPYQQTKTPDDYRCFVLDWPAAKELFVTGYQVKPGNTATVHHLIAFLVKPNNVKHFQDLDAKAPGPGYPCYGGPGGQTSWLAGWAPGNPGGPFPDGTGIRVAPGSKVVIQMHYNSFASNPDPDQTELLLMTNEKVEKEAFIIPFANPSWTRDKTMHIPANKDNVTHSFGFYPSLISQGKPVTVYNASLHMHTLGKSGEIFVERNGEQTCLLRIPRWDFNWQRPYVLKKPIILQPGDKLSIRCTWDNTQKNQPYFEGKQLQSKDVNWGEGTTDEMCLGVLFVTL